MDQLAELLALLFGQNSEGFAGRRLRNAYEEAGPLWDAPHVKGLPMSLVPRDLDVQHYRDQMLPLWRYLFGMGRV